MLKGLLNSEQNELGNSIVKLIANRIPGIDVGIEFFEFRGRLKQNRINKFIELLQQYLENSGLNKRIHFDLLNEEEFTDLFESVLRRVAVTKSLEKLDRFKLVIAKSLLEPKEITFADSFLDLINELNEKQIEILKCYNEIDNSLKRDGLLKINNTLLIELAKQKELKAKGEENKYEEIKEKLSYFFRHRKHEFYKITQGEYLFFVQSLSAKSLLIDYGLGGIEVNPYDLMGITEYGIKFLEFIETS